MTSTCLNLYRIAIGLFVFILPVDNYANAQPTGPVVGHAIRHAVSPPLRDIHRPVTPATPFELEAPLLAPPHITRPPNVPGAADPGRQVKALPFALPEAAATPQPFLNFDGLSDDDNADVVGVRRVPPDTEGDVGPNHYVQWINVIFQVWQIARDINGNPVSVTPVLSTPLPGNVVWNNLDGHCRDYNEGDPIVLYDHLAGRWLFSQMLNDLGIQCVALSQTGDPTGPYDLWEFEISPDQSNDYPKLGVMPDAYYLMVRDFPSNDGDFAVLIAFDKSAMLAGSTEPTFVKFSLPCNANDCPDGIQPPHLEGPAPPPGTPGIFTRAWDDDFDGPLTGADGYRLWAFSPNFAVPALSTFTELPFIQGTAFDSTMCGDFDRDCIPQPGKGTKLDPIDELQMYRAQYRHFDTYDSILINTTVDATGTDVAGIRWAELRNNGNGWALYQDGTYAPDDGLHRWMGSAAIDQNGNIALGYSVSNRDTFPSIRYTSRLATDPPGVMPGGEVEMTAGSDVQTGSSRWGDYSTMSVDPVDGCTFWYTQEYQRKDDKKQSFDFKTRIGTFKLSDCGVPPQPPLIPNSPSELTATAGNTGQGKNRIPFVDLAWLDNSDNEDEFIIQRSVQTGNGANKTCDKFIDIGTASENITVYRDEIVVSGTTYCYKVRASNENGASEPSNMVTVRVN